METKIVLQRHTKLGRISAGAQSALIARAEFRFKSNLNQIYRDELVKTFCLEYAWRHIYILGKYFELADRLVREAVMRIIGNVYQK